MEKITEERKKEIKEIQKVRDELLEEDPELQDFFSHPLNSIQITPELLANPAYQGIQSLIYDGEPEEIAQNFLKAGKERLKEATEEQDPKKSALKLANAMNCFTKGIAEECKDKEINYELHLLMARCEFQQKNYGKLKEHVDQALKNKETAQLYYYGAISRLNTEKWDDCVEYCKGCLKIEDSHEKCRELMKIALVKQMKEKKKMEEMALINKLENEKMQKLYYLIKSYGIKIGSKLHFLPEDIGANLYIDEYNILHFPVIILYDEFMQCDFIQDFGMNTTFREQLSQVLSQPAPWDPEHRYKIDAVDVFYETNITAPLDADEKIVEGDKYVKVDLDSELLPVLQDEKHVVPQYPIFVVVAKDFKDYAKYTS
ncbi:unnamed protein product [Moneuplotes crassus]|uniref:Cns1/TTC4 wheel domain-containing protein n=1 Tax=Euplotes crassus TaxID=5936 RepID=A0AAD1XEM8_EUPCR|nr:unnamed protein product [Moneuplotes crassus]